ncbi:hypothetical protein Tco_0418673 [Tanacetum coccineum]
MKETPYELLKNEQNKAKVTAIEEAKDLATLPLDELVRNLKVYEMVLDNDGVGSKTTKEKVKSLALKDKVTREKTSDDSDSQGNRVGRGNQFGNGGNRFGKGRGNSFGNKGGADNCPKSNKKALVGVTWSDSEDGDKTRNDATCLMAIDSQEVQPNPSTSNNDSNIINFQKENQELLKFSKDFSKAYEKLLQEKRALEKEHSKLFSKVNELELEVKKLARNKESSTVLDDMSSCQKLSQDKEGYSQTSKAYIVLNKETLKIEESLNVTFDESLPKSRTSPLVDDDMIEEQAIQNHDKTQNPNCDLEEVIPRVENIREVRDHPIDQNLRTLRKPSRMKVGQWLYKRNLTNSYVTMFGILFLVRSTCQSFCDEFSRLMHDEFEMSMMGDAVVVRLLHEVLQLPKQST